MIQAVQSVASPLLDSLMLFFTNLHHKDFYVLTLPLLYWFYDKHFTRYMLSVFLFGYWTNGALKFAFATTRPPLELARPGFADTAPGGAFPSGHAQNPLMIWGALALHLQRRWFTLMAVLVVFLIGFSRLYGGVHWPVDTLGGWLIGGLMLMSFQRSQGFWLGEGMTLRQRLLWAAVIPLATLLVWRSSPWNTDAKLAGDSWVLTGAYIGTWVGAILEAEWVGFDPRRGGPAVHLLKLVVGVAVIFGLRYALKAVLPPLAAADGLRYLIIGLAMTLALPWFFNRFPASPSVGREIAK